MKQKNMYTLDELCDNLTISLSEFSSISGVNEGTLARIRKGYTARRKTVNRLLESFSEVYGIEFSLDNVTGIILEDKKEIRRQMLARKGINEKAERPSVPATPARIPRVAKEKAPTRVYNRKQDTNLPDSCILASKFAVDHGIARPTFIDHMTKGLGPGLIGMSTDTIPQRDQVDYSERQKPNRPTEKEKYLTQQQQHDALKFWKRHAVSFAECNDIGCWCHTIKSGE